MPRKQDPILQALSRFEKKVDSLDSRLDSVDKTLVKQEANLGEHMRRTELAEKNIEKVQQDSKEAVTKLETEMAPVKKHVAHVEGFLKGIGLLATVVSLLAGLAKLVMLIVH
jgi:hypothetical protein